MDIPRSSLSEKSQTTMPLEIRKMFNIEPNDQVLWIPVAPGLLSLVSVKKYKKGTWAESICGKYADDSWDSLEELKKYKKEDLELEKRGLED